MAEGHLFRDRCSRRRENAGGLNVVHNPALRQQGRSAGVFLSGNGPLVRIVSAAIARDFKRRTRQTGGDREVRTLVQNVHTFVRAALENQTARRPKTSSF